MSNIIGIVNYGTAGNLHSVEKALNKATGKTLIINNLEQFNQVDKIVSILDERPNTNGSRPDNVF